MKLKILGIARNVLLIFVVLVILFVFDVSAVTVTTNTKFAVGNETYTFSHTMNFHTITVGESYIIFNETGFYVSSGNDITITVVYINDDITYADDAEKVLEFVAETTAGSVVFDLSGFPVGNTYNVKRSGSSIATPTTDGSGFISFTNSVWSSHLFEIFQVGEGVVNSPPVVSNIPGQTILEGADFTQINLDNYVTDAQDSDEDVDWSYSGNTELLVSIVNRVATISTPNSNWYGVETITFTARDTGGLTDSDDATFTVTANNPPSPPPPSGPPSLPPESPGDDTEENNPPASPLALSGPTFVEMGVEYGYVVSTTDSDGDQIRYRFDWGDGTLSDWSELVDSGVTASLYHSWMDIDTYQVRAIAQDEHGLNSSWSALLNVTVSGVNDGGEPSVADIGVSGNFSANQTIAFDASGAFDGVIVSYFWDFGDGTTGTGVNSTHVYTQPGKYTVILTAIDNENNTYSKSIDVTILSANAQANEQKLQDKRFIPAISFMPFIILITFALAIFLVVFFRKHIKSLVFIDGIYLVRRLKLSYAKSKMKRIVAKSAKLGVKMDELHAALNEGTVVGQAPSRPAGIYYSKMQEEHLKTYESVDSEDESAPEMTSSIDEVRTGATIDKLVKMELAKDAYVEKYAHPSIEDVEREIDNLFVQKIREAIDNL